MLLLLSIVGVSVDSGRTIVWNGMDMASYDQTTLDGLIGRRWPPTHHGGHHILLLTTVSSNASSSRTLRAPVCHLPGSGGGSIGSGTYGIVSQFGTLRPNQ